MIAKPIARRSFMVGTAATGLFALTGCESLGGYSFTEAIRRLLLLSSEGAFARLTAPGGFWDSSVARLALPDLFGSRGGVVAGILTSGPFKEQLQRRLNYIAEDGARRAAPIVADTVRTIGIDNAVAIIKGGPTAATSFLRNGMGPGLINAMIPALGDALRVSSDPVIGQAIRALSGVDVNQVAQAVANSADNAIWYQIGLEETDIRANPEKTNDPLLIGVLKAL
jgi:Protein of unknown function (DUF4197)